MNKRELGREGEQIACNFLVQKGYKILERNWTSRWCEVDIIAVKDSILVFVEVKYRKNLRYGTGVEAINYKKTKTLVYSVNKYVSKNKLQRYKYRIDVIVIDIVNKEVKIKYFENATDYFLSTPVWV